MILNDEEQARDVGMQLRDPFPKSTPKMVHHTGQNKITKRNNVCK